MDVLGVKFWRETVGDERLGFAAQHRDHRVLLLVRWCVRGGRRRILSHVHWDSKEDMARRAFASLLVLQLVDSHSDMSYDEVIERLAQMVLKQQLGVCSVAVDGSRIPEAPGLCAVIEDQEKEIVTSPS